MKKIGTNYNSIINYATERGIFNSEVREIQENKEQGFNVKTLILKLKCEIEKVINKKENEY